MNRANSRPYDDIIHLPHPASSKYPRMSVATRAAIFSPFAALTGHSAAIEETFRLTDRRIELSEEAKAELDMKQQLLADAASTRPEVSVTWFQPDERKDGGAYVTTTGRLKKIDAYERMLVMTEGSAIPLDDVLEIQSELFRGLFQDE